MCDIPAGGPYPILMSPGDYILHILYPHQSLPG